MFADPPSVEGTAGPQIGDGALGAVAVELAACVELSSPSPGSCSGDCELFDAAAPTDDPPAAEDDDRDDVGTLNGSEATPAPLLLLV